MKIEDKLVLAIKASIKSGEILLNNYSEETVKKFNLKSTNNRDIFSRVDIESENEILNLFKKKNKEKINFQFEEKGYIKNNDKNKSVWIVDALDGTVNYIHNIPFFYISIALKEKNILKFGVIYNPLSNEIYYSYWRFFSLSYLN